LCATYSPRDPLGEYLGGTLSLRALRVLVEGLPPDSAYHRARRGHDWSESEYLSWAIESRLRDLNAALANLVRKAGTSAQKPTYLPTPDEGTVAEAVIDEKYQEQQIEEFDEVTSRMFV